jgi:hypothetical protein
MKMKFFNEIPLRIQLPSNSTNASMFTLSSPHLHLPTNYIFNAHGEEYHQLGKLWLNLCVDTCKYCDTFLMINEKHDFFYWFLQKSFTFKVHLTFFHHLQCAFITFFNPSMFYFPKKSFKVFNNYLMLNLTHGCGILKGFYVWSSPNTCV